MDPLTISAIVSGGVSLLSSLLGNKVQKKQTEHLTGAQIEANQFSASQAQLSREWSDTMYNQYNSPAALVRQYNDAGINPALMFGGTTPAAPTDSSSASSVSPSGDPSAMLGFLASMANIASDVALKNSQAKLNLAKTKATDIENEFKPAIFEQNLREGEINIANAEQGIKESLSRVALNSANIDSLVANLGLTDARIKQIESDISLKEKQTIVEELRAANLAVTNENIVAATALSRLQGALVAAQTALTKAQTSQTSESTNSIQLDNWQREFDKAYRTATGVKPGQNIWSAASDVIGYGIVGAKNLIHKIFD